jgi:hypothetical protein
MTILQQSSNARDRKLSEWYERIRTGQLKLPRFQRFEAWDRGRVVGFLNTIIQNLPVGVTLLLEVGDKEKFVSRHVATAPEAGARVTEHLLDGQQRLTAFWRAMHNNYEGEKYFVYLPQFDQRDDDDRDADDICIEFQGRWQHKDTLRPVWADSPKGCLGRGLVPVDLLRPGDMDGQISEWIANATAHMEPPDDAADAMPRYKKLTRDARGTARRAEHTARACRALQLALSGLAGHYGGRRCAEGVRQHEHQQQAVVHVRPYRGEGGGGGRRVTAWPARAARRSTSTGDLLRRSFLAAAADGRAAAGTRTQSDGRCLTRQAAAGEGLATTAKGRRQGG